MNLALAWFGKEWRGQWRLLGAYVLLVVASVALVCWLLPAEYWQRAGGGAQALAWFFALGVVGALLFAAPQLVRGEFAPKDDQFVRRLPGALAPAWAGKLLFLLLASLLLPLLTLLCGEAALWAMGRSWGDLFGFAPHDPEVWTVWPFAGVAAAAALLLAPWIAAVGTWLPGGRMAVGGLFLLLLLLTIVVVMTLQTCPGLEKTVAWEPWLWALWPAGALLFAVSWRGRRGGSAGRSAVFGGATLAALIAGPGGWLAQQTWCYRNPDPQRLVDLRAHGVTTDGRFALVAGTGNAEWQAHPQFRIDLATGAAAQMCPVWDWLAPASLTRWSPLLGGLRWWRRYGDGDRSQILDLSNGTWTDVARRTDSSELVLTGALRTAIEADVRGRAPYSLPGGRRAWRDGESLAIERPDGGVELRPWPPQLGRVLALSRGHGIVAFPNAHVPVLYDLARDRAVDAPKGVSDAWLVGSEWLVRDAANGWSRLDPDTGVLEPRFRGGWCHGLLDDDRLVFTRIRGRKGPQEMFTFRPADCRVEAIELPPDLHLQSRHFSPTIGAEVDARGRRWFAASALSAPSFWPGASLHVALDPTTLRAEAVPVEPGQAFAFVGEFVLTIEDGRRIVRTDWTTGARQVLYPMAERTGH